jgi:hypothetical protein
LEYGPCVVYEKGDYEMDSHHSFKESYWRSENKLYEGKKSNGRECMKVGKLIVFSFSFSFLFYIIPI